MIVSIILIAIGWGMFFLSMRTYSYNKGDKNYEEDKSTTKWLIILGLILNVIAIAIAPESW